jgi:hypothetical protein
MWPARDRPKFEENIRKKLKDMKHIVLGRIYLRERGSYDRQNNFPVSVTCGLFIGQFSDYQLPEAPQLHAGSWSFGQLVT